MSGLALATGFPRNRRLIHDSPSTFVWYFAILISHARLQFLCS